MSGGLERAAKRLAEHMKRFAYVKDLPKVMSRQQRRRAAHEAAKAPVPHCQSAQPSMSPGWGSRRLKQTKVVHGKTMVLHATRGWKHA
jgi:hypothetical protein